MPEPAEGARRQQAETGPSLLDRLTDAAVWVFALVAVALFRIVDSTIDLRVFGYEHIAAALRRDHHLLLVVWHGKGLLPIFFFQGLPLVVYTSEARDARPSRLSRNVRRLTLAALTHLGYHVLDAAQFKTESRGVVRFLQLLQRERGGIIAADGPKGPVYRAHPGAAYFARKTGVLLIPVGAALRDAVALDSWDRFEIPRPFTRAALAVGDPLTVPEEVDDAGLTALSKRLETVMNDLTAQAEVEAFASRPA